MKTREALECPKQSLVVDSSGNLEGQRIDKDADNKDCPYKALGGNKVYTRIWARSHSYCVQRKYLTVFCLCPEKLNEVEL